MQAASGLHTLSVWADAAALRCRLAGNLALRHHSNALTLTTQERLVTILEEHTGTDGRADVRIRLLPELALAAWRCGGVKNWDRSWH